MLAAILLFEATFAPSIKLASKPAATIWRWKPADLVGAETNKTPDDPG
jgi:hypothetical protein